ncbi:hypothetical protein O5D80_008389 [Batrachochytrium dendrobatidis]|nr:hypothetical protein O5D80_008389 [Batrachochytrium dendrobatidis]
MIISRLLQAVPGVFQTVIMPSISRHPLLPIQSLLQCITATPAQPFYNTVHPSHSRNHLTNATSNKHNNAHISNSQEIPVNHQYSSQNMHQPYTDPILASVLNGQWSTKKKDKELDSQLLFQLSSHLDADRIAKAFLLFHQFEKHNPSILKRLSSSHFSLLIYSVLTCRFNILRHQSVEARRDYAVRIFHIMQSVGVKPDAQTYELMIHTHAYIGDTKTVEALYADMKQCGFPTDTISILNDLARVYLLSSQQTRGLAYFEMACKLGKSDVAFNELIKTYLLNNDESAMLGALKLLRNTGGRPSTSTMVDICRYYLFKENHQKIHQHLQDFKVEGGLIETTLWNIQLCAANQVGDHVMTLSLLAEMRLSQIPFNYETQAEELVALAYSKNRRRFWRVYSLMIKQSRPTLRVVKALATMEGPLINDRALHDMQASIAMCKMIQFDTLLAVITGYGAIGDVQSIHIILDILSKVTRVIPDDTFESLIKAYCISGNVGDALEYTKKTKVVSMQTCELVLDTAVLQKHELINKIVAEIKQKYPSVDTSLLLSKANDRVTNPILQKFTIDTE